MITVTYDTPSGRKIVMEREQTITGRTKVVHFTMEDGVQIKSSYAVDDRGYIDLNVLESARILLRNLGLHGLAEDIETSNIKVSDLVRKLLRDADADWRDHYAIKPNIAGGYDVLHVKSSLHVKSPGRTTQLTNRGYPTKQMAERVCEMRFKLKLDEPESKARTYLRSHFTEVFRELEQ